MAAHVAAAGPVSVGLDASGGGMGVLFPWPAAGHTRGPRGDLYATLVGHRFRLGRGGAASGRTSTTFGRSSTTLVLSAPSVFFRTFGPMRPRCAEASFVSARQADGANLRPNPCQQTLSRNDLTLEHLFSCSLLKRLVLPKPRTDRALSPAKSSTTVDMILSWCAFRHRRCLAPWSHRPSGCGGAICGQVLAYRTDRLGNPQLSFPHPSPGRKHHFSTKFELSSADGQVLNDPRTGLRAVRLSSNPPMPPGRELGPRAVVAHRAVPRALWADRERERLGGVPHVSAPRGGGRWEESWQASSPWARSAFGNFGLRRSQRSRRRRHCKVERFAAHRGTCGLQRSAPPRIL